MIDAGVRVRDPGRVPSPVEFKLPAGSADRARAGEPGRRSRRGVARTATGPGGRRKPDGSAGECAVESGTGRRFGGPARAAVPGGLPPPGPSPSRVLVGNPLPGFPGPPRPRALCPRSLPRPVGTLGCMVGSGTGARLRGLRAVPRRLRAGRGLLLQDRRCGPARGAVALAAAPPADRARLDTGGASHCRDGAPLDTAPRGPSLLIPRRA